MIATYPALDDAPFVLIDDARDDTAVARVYRRPVETLVATRLCDIDGLLDSIEAARFAGLHVAGFLGYEAGLAFEPCLASLERAATGNAAPLAWFGVFDDCEDIDAAEVAALLPDPAGAWLGAPQPLITREHHTAQVAKVLDHIVAGEIYQANLTFPTRVPYHGHPLAIYARLRTRAQAGHGGVVWTGAHWLLSLSPELFFDLNDGVATARPMKGTARRDADPMIDAKLGAELHTSPKQRAENLMIVDLLRNDLSRVSVAGSVQVPRLFDVETYPTVHQMTSTVTARLQPGKGAVDLIRNGFPCGSVTGAPKIRAMEIIHEIEAGPRGPYTGSIGFIEPCGDASFNVAIRTLVFTANGLQPPLALAASGLHPAKNHATLCLGSGIVADSRADDEWRECLAKGEFVSGGEQAFDLLETMGFDPVEGLTRLDRHIARMKASALALGLPFDRHAARNQLHAATFRIDRPSKVRLRLSPSGETAIEVRDKPETPVEAVPVTLAPHPFASHDVRLAHKTTDREAYEAARHESGEWEVVFVNQTGAVTEGSFTNVFVERGGILLTPSLSAGLLAGVLRSELLEEGKANEAMLHPADLAGGFLLGNSVHGLFPARLAEVAGAKGAG